MSERAAKRTSGCLSHLLLDRLMAGELTGPDKDRAEHHIADCARCASLRRQREAEQQDFRATWSPAARTPTVTPTAAAKVKEPLATPSPARWRTRVLGVGVVALAAAAVVLIPRARWGQEGTGAGTATETTTAKGRAWLRFFVRDGKSGAVRAGTRADNVAPGDAIRFGFDRHGVDERGDRYLAVLGRDASGKVSVYFPERGTTAARSAPTEDGLLPYSIVLDETLGVETLYALACADPVALGPLEDDLRGADALATPASCQVERITLVKRARR